MQDELNTIERKKERTRCTAIVGPHVASTNVHCYCDGPRASGVGDGGCCALVRGSHSYTSPNLPYKSTEGDAAHSCVARTRTRPAHTILAQAPSLAMSLAVGEEEAARRSRERREREQQARRGQVIRGRRRSRNQRYDGAGDALIQRNALHDRGRISRQEGTTTGARRSRSGATVLEPRARVNGRGLVPRRAIGEKGGRCH